MKARDFLKILRDHEIAAAIRAAEKRTSGEIRVFISRKDVDDPLAAAQEHFLKLGMSKTRDHNAVLIYVAPRARKFAVVGDKGVHERCGDEFWRQLADEMSGYFRDSRFTRGIIHGVHKAGELLAAQFPRAGDDKNELPDRIEGD
ncbi:MAG TPA: TPM domain-containing protein [Verrucomicrobiae bacterium]|nr:TPM domain-containing protein [Verrucomicrobiae bacterium]